MPTLIPTQTTVTLYLQLVLHQLVYCSASSRLPRLQIVVAGRSLIEEGALQLGAVAHNHSVPACIKYRQLDPQRDLRRMQIGASIGCFVIQIE